MVLPIGPLKLSFLALPLDHPFWSKPEECFPHPDKLLLSVPRMLVTHTNDHVCLYPAGQHSAEKGACSAKYEKFVYSNRFGFSVPHGQTLGGAAMDSTFEPAPLGGIFITHATVLMPARYENSIQKLPIVYFLQLV